MILYIGLFRHRLPDTITLQQTSYRISKAFPLCSALDTACNEQEQKKEAGSPLTLKKKPPLQHGWAPFVSAYFYPQTQVSLDSPVTSKACMGDSKN